MGVNIKGKYYSVIRRGKAVMFDQQPDKLKR
jgi:hypothetical protein